MEPKRCLGCGYILDHLPEPRCPECGRGFDPQDARTYATHTEPGWVHLGFAIAGVFGLLSPLFGVVISRVFPPAQPFALIICAIAAMGGLMIEIAMFGGSLAELRRPLVEQGRHVLVAAAIISGVALLACCAYVGILLLRW